MPEYLQKVIDDIYQDFELDRVTAYRHIELQNAVVKYLQENQDMVELPEELKKLKDFLDANLLNKNDSKNTIYYRDRLDSILHSAEFALQVRQKQFDHENEMQERVMFEFIIAVVFLSIPILILIGTIKRKSVDVYNPCKWNNNDYKLVKVENIKTRNIF